MRNTNSIYLRMIKTANNSYWYHKTSYKNQLEYLLYLKDTMEIIKRIENNKEQYYLTSRLAKWNKKFIKNQIAKTEREMKNSKKMIDIYWKRSKLELETSLG